MAAYARTHLEQHHREEAKRRGEARLAGEFANSITDVN
jgi:hypothetical protein